MKMTRVISFTPNDYHSQMNCSRSDEPRKEHGKECWSLWGQLVWVGLEGEMLLLLCHSEFDLGLKRTFLTRHRKETNNKQRIFGLIRLVNW